MFRHWVCILMGLLLVTLASAGEYESDTIKTSDGPLVMTFIGHGTLMFEFGGKVIHIDPFSRVSDYTDLPKEDLILVTHEHGDHLDGQVIQKLSGENTKLLLSQAAFEQHGSGTVLKNGEVKTVNGIQIEAVPAYNIAHKRDNGQPFHPRGRGNGYVLTLGGKRVYVAGDTENIPEMKDLKDIDVAFLPMNLPYTMSPEMAADAAKTIKPAILYPYHFGSTDTNQLVELLKEKKDIEVRIRSLQ